MFEKMLDKSEHSFYTRNYIEMTHPKSYKRWWHTSDSDRSFCLHMNSAETAGIALQSSCRAVLQFG